MNKLSEKLPHLNKRKIRKKAQEKEDEIKRNLQMANQSCNYWIFQIHWNKLELVNPRNNSEVKNCFCISSKRFYLKDNNKTSHWVGHSKLKTLYLKDFYNRKIIINEIEAGLNGNKIGHSDYVMKNNTDASIVAEVENDDTDLTVDSGKTDEDDKNM